MITLLALTLVFSLGVFIGLASGRIFCGWHHQDCLSAKELRAAEKGELPNARERHLYACDVCSQLLELGRKVHAASKDGCCSNPGLHSDQH